MRQLGGFSVAVVPVAQFVPTVSCRGCVTSLKNRQMQTRGNALHSPVGGGGRDMGYIWKALENAYLEHPGSACCTDSMFEIFVRFGQCLCSLLPLFVNRQLPCLCCVSAGA